VTPVAQRPVRPGDHEPIAGPHAVSLRPVADSDIDDLFRWLHEREVVQWWGEPPADLDTCREENVGPDDDAPTWRFIIEERGRPVGMIQYWHEYYDEHYWFSAGIDIFIGEPAARNRGVGTEAVRTMLAYLFEVKQLHRVTIDPQTDNARAIRAYEKAGFRRDGVLRHNDRMHGRYVDTQMLSILEDEWPEAKAGWLAGRG
jgi:aminoglycoside 6'-N-acetyltransferase